MTADNVNHPPHYRQDASGLECVEILEHFHSPLLAQTFKYIWRHEDKSSPIEDVDKAIWFVAREHDYRSKHERRTPTRPKEARTLFTQWRRETFSDLRAAALANVWRLDGDGKADLLEFYTLAEILSALKGGLR